jgi:hypothetical protein
MCLCMCICRHDVIWLHTGHSWQRHWLGHHHASVGGQAAKASVVRETVRLGFIATQIGWVVKQHVRWEDRHRVSQGAELLLAVCEATTASKFANAYQNAITIEHVLSYRFLGNFCRPRFCSCCARLQYCCARETPSVTDRLYCAFQLGRGQMSTSCRESNCRSAQSGDKG